MSAVLPTSQVVSSELDRHFAAFIGRFGGDSVLLQRAAAALSRSVREGNVCLSLSDISAGDPDAGPVNDEAWPGAREWRAALEQSGAVGPPEGQSPLVLDDCDRLYLRRYWNYQSRLAHAIRERCARNSLFVRADGATQDDAVEAALANNLTILCGGPGTGKTSTVVRILSRLFSQSGGERLRVALTAPTGKAASRLDESIREGNLADAGEPMRLLIQQGARTIHRLLERRGRSSSFRYNSDNPLPIDVLIVDEASMVALPLLAKLFDAVRPECRVLLVGDRDQLASVEPGAVLADMVDAAAVPGSPLMGHLVTLRENFRFSGSSDIQKACNAVREGDAASLVDALKEAAGGDLVSSQTSTLSEMRARVALRASEALAAAVAERDPAAALKAFRKFRVLTPLRQGPWGVAGLTETIEATLRAAGLIGARGGDTPYPGKPILILQNDYDLGLYNGDTGVLLPDPGAPSQPDQLYGWFVGKDEQVRRFAHARLPEHETAYAMTVHKSQGSEFDHVLFVLPEQDSPLLTRELVYTALTRARTSVEFIWNEPVLREAVNRSRRRESGLRDLLTAP